MTIEEFIKLAEAYVDLGWAVQEQMCAVALSGDPVEEQNPNALELAANLLRGLAAADVDGAEELAGEVSDYLEDLRTAR